MPKRIPYEPGQIAFITSTTWQRWPVFREQANIRMLLKDFDFYRDKFHYLIYAWVIMPDHFHWLIQPSAADFERFYDEQIRRQGKYSHDPSLYYLSYIMERLDSHSAQVMNKRPGVPLWQPGFHDRYIRDKKGLHDAIAYIHNNPIKAGLGENIDDYPWSSYRAMNTGDDSLLRLDELTI